MTFAKQLLPLLYLVSAVCLGQTSSIEIVANSDDNVGQRLVSVITERIRASTAMTVTAKRDIPRMVVSIVTLDPAPPNGMQTIYSVIFVYDDPSGPLRGVYLGNSVGLCASAQTQRCADTIVADMDGQVDFVRQTRLPLR